jgi:hypothetical protein
MIRSIVRIISYVMDLIQFLLLGETCIPPMLASSLQTPMALLAVREASLLTRCTPPHCEL